MKYVNSFLKDISTQKKTYLEKKDFLQTIFSKYGISLDGKEIEIRGSELCISFSPSERMIVGIKKQEILEVINNESKWGREIKTIR